MSINLSAHQLRADLAEDLTALTVEHDVPPPAVHLEITESVLMDDVNRSIENLVGLKATGVLIEVDDFGTGYSSLSYLRRFPIDALKIDRSFVDGLDENPHDWAIVRAIVSVGHALDLVVIAEGIETCAQRDRLRDLGCDLGQGFLWSRPTPAGEASDLLGRPPRAEERGPGKSGQKG
jgi:EAL domain-containing protein (putative c-di-GMP-specific phosphodiesterase class I)